MADRPDEDSGDGMAKLNESIMMLHEGTTYYFHILIFLLQTISSYSNLFGLKGS